MALENLIDITDPEKKGWLRDFNSFTKAPKYAFGASDSGIERFRFVEKTNDDRLRMKDASLAGAVVEVLVGPLRGEISTGTWDLTIDGDDTGTTDLSPIASAASLEASLNSNPGLTAYGFVSVTKFGGAYQIVFDQNGAVPAPVINAEELLPGGSLAVLTELQTGSASQPEIWWLRFVTEPYAYNATWTNYSTGNAVITTEQAGSSSVYEVQRIQLVPDPWDGSITVNLTTFEKFKIQCTTNAAGAVEGKGFITADENGTVGVWYNGGGDTIPADVNACDRIIEITTVTGGETAVQVASETATALAADAAFTATSSGKTVTVTNEVGGTRDDAADSESAPTGFTFTTTQAGTFTTGTIPIDASPRDFAAALQNKVTVTKGPNPYSWDLTYKQLGNQPLVTVETQATFPNGYEGTLNFKRPATFQAVELAIAEGLTEISAYCQIMITEAGSGSRMVYRDTHPVLFSVLSQGDGGGMAPAAGHTVSASVLNGAALGLVGLTGGGDTKLDGVGTNNLSTAVITLTDPTHGWGVWELVAGTSAESSPGIIRPDDYASSTNEKIWLRRI